MSYSSPLSKTDLMNAIAEDTGMQRKDVKAVLDSLSGVIAGHMAPGAAGVFKMPGLFKIAWLISPPPKRATALLTLSVRVRPWMWLPNQPAAG